jgi:hypothetical protein
MHIHLGVGQRSEVWAMKGFLGVLNCVVLPGAAAACGSNDGDGGMQTTSEVDSRLSDLYTAAKAEGELTW